MGFWDDKPEVAANSVNGWMFLQSGNFIYWNDSTRNLMVGYHGTYGKWKIEENILYILGSKDIFYREIPDLDIPFFMRDSEYYAKTAQIDSWVPICNLETFSNNDPIYEHTPIRLTVSMLEIYNGQVTSHLKTYYKMNDTSITDETSYENLELED